MELHSNTTLESRILASYVARTSMLVLLMQMGFIPFLRRAMPQRLLGAEALSKADRITIPSSYILAHGGWTILPYQILRLVANVVVLVLMIATASSKGSAIGDIALTIVSAYATILACFLLHLPVTKSGSISFHATVASLAVLGPYTYRDTWPLLTFILVPADTQEGLFIWAKVIVATIGGVLVPLFEPYVYVPFDPSKPQATANSEQSAPLIQYLTFSFINEVIYGSQKVNHVSLDMLGPQLDTDTMAALQPKTFRYLDPFHDSRREVSMYKAVFVPFAGSWLVQGTCQILHAFAILGSPVAVNKLLAYVESPGSNWVVRLWAWIMLIALAPLITNMIQQLYTFINTRTATQLEAVITAAIYQHSLRVRVTSNVKDSASPPTSPTPQLPTTGTINVSAPPLPAPYPNTSSQSTRTVSPAITVVGSEDGVRKMKEGPKQSDPSRIQDGEITGRLNSLITADMSNILGGKDWLFATVNSALQIALASWFLCSILGWPAILGLITMLIMAPVPAWVSSFMNTVQKKKMAATDARVQYVKEILNILRMVKQFGWESKVREEVDLKREDELRWVLRRKMLSLINIVVNHTIPLVHMIVTFIVYTLVLKQPLKASVLFSALTGFHMLRLAMHTFVFFLPQLINAHVSLRRVEEFLNETELLDAFNNQPVIEDSSPNHMHDIGLGHASFFWSAELCTDGSATISPQKFRLRIEDDVVFKRGALNLVIGPTGCGKTSLLLALLGEMHFVPFGPGAWRSLPRQNGVAYCAQEAWIQSVSIKDNILFGAPYDQERYHKVIYQCGLKRDLLLFDAGDLTEVGEKGMTLSGGQKARISLARAVYSSAQTILLDDVLAALDVHTSVWIVKKCLKGDLMEGRTIILVTHNLALTSPVADMVVSVGSDGRAVSQGKPRIVLVDGSVAQEMNHEAEAIEFEVDLEDQRDVKTVAGKGSKLVLAEEIQEGHVSWTSIALMVTNLSAWPLLWWCGYIFGCVADEAAEVFQIWWLGHWAAQYTPGKIVDVF